MRTIYHTLLFLFVFGTCNNSPHYFKPDYVKDLPEPKGYVNDFEKSLTDSEIAVLDSTIVRFEKESTNQIVIVTVSSIVPYDTIREFATDLANRWGVGQKEKDNGLIIVFSKALRDVWIGTGFGTEKILTDSICKQIVDSSMIPHFKNEEYFEGIHAGLTECIRRWK